MYWEEQSFPLLVILIKGRFPVNLWEERSFRKMKWNSRGGKKNGSFLLLSSGKELIFLPLREIIYISRILIAWSLSQLENSFFWWYFNNRILSYKDILESWCQILTKKISRYDRWKGRMIFWAKPAAAIRLDHRKAFNFQLFLSVLISPNPGAPVACLMGSWPQCPARVVSSAI